MQTRLSVFCEKLLEAGWLAAIIVAPLYFDVYTSRVFEPDKGSLVRSLALLMAGAWLVKRIEAGLPKTSLGESMRAAWRENPLILPTLAVVFVYILSTILSVAPNVTFWGSYQRLQGTYTTLSYIVIFLTTASTLRTRAQLDRAINTAIVTSFPIAFYGILQHYKLDPLPWGGDTTERVAANMGNAIFVGAYLIMIVPITLARLLETLARATAKSPSRIVSIGLVVAALMALIVLWMFDFTFAMIFVFLFMVALVVVGIWKSNLRDALFLAAFSIVIAAQLVAIFFTQSRGPWLGIAGGLFAFVFLGLTAIRRQIEDQSSLKWSEVFKAALLGIGSILVGILPAYVTLVVLKRGLRWLWLAWAMTGFCVFAFLVVFNLPSSPLAPLRQLPYIGRLGQIFDTEAGTNKVRDLIWQGAVQLVLPHDPLWSPTTGDDAINFIRPLVGYGPETMYVAYNPFYPPDLAHYEARNASPDRSHNETFDSLVTTGLLGFGAYILLFISIFYYGLKLLGLIQTAGERNAFVILWLAGGFIAALGFGLWLGWNFVGVALPAGMIVGFFVFLVIDVLRTPNPAAGQHRSVSDSNALWLTALIAAFIAHFIEIHFGIAIVSTRTYFWFYAALLVVIGLNKVAESTPQVVTAPRPVNEEATPPTTQRRRQRRRMQETTRAVSRSDDEISATPVLVWTAVGALIMMTMAFEFVTNQAGTTSKLDAVFRSLFFMGGNTSLGIFLMFALTWTIIGIVGLAGRRDPRAGTTTWVYDTLLFVVLSFTIVLWFVMIQTSMITTPGDLTGAFISLLSLYYVSLFIVVLALATAFWFDVSPRPSLTFRYALSALALPVVTILVAAGVYLTNYNGIQADILYKAGNNFDAQGAWDQSIATYKSALDLQQSQDFYALFLGRAYLEAARAAPDAAKRAALIQQSENTLLMAQRLNPLNTDHSANLARLNRIVATMTDNPAEKATRFKKSSDYYAETIRLSPNTAHLRNEWYLTYSQSGDWQNAKNQLDISAQLDPLFPLTFVYLGDYYRAQNDPSNAVTNYLKALDLDPAALTEVDGTLQAGAATVLTDSEFYSRTVDAFRRVATKNPTLVGPHYILADLFKRTGKLDLAQQELLAAYKINPNDMTVNLALANFYSENGQIDPAVNSMKRVMSMLPTNRPDYSRFQDFANQLIALQQSIQAAQKSPNDIELHRALANRWKSRGQPQFALPEYQTIIKLAPKDYDASKNLVLLNLQTNHLDDAQNALVNTASLAPDNEKPIWQNAQVAINAQKTGQFDQALKAAQAMLTQVADADKPAVQAYIAFLQDKVNSGK